jgi:hypothetical protein
MDKFKAIFIILIAAALLCLLPIAVMAQSPKCDTLEFVKTEVAKNPQLIFSAVIEGETERFIRVLKSANDGFSKLEALRIGVLSMRGGDTVVIMAFNEKGCAFQNWPIPAKYFFDIMQDKGI